EQVVGGDGGGGALQVGRCGAEQIAEGDVAGGAVADGDDRLQGRKHGAGGAATLGEGVLDHGEADTSVAQHVGDAVGRGGVVDRHRRAPGQQDPHVGDVELRPV